MLNRDESLLISQINEKKPLVNRVRLAVLRRNSGLGDCQERTTACIQDETIKFDPHGQTIVALLAGHI